MSFRNSSNKSSGKPSNADIDTEKPIPSVMAAVSMYGEKIGGGRRSRPQTEGKRFGKEPEPMDQQSEELAKVRLKLKEAEKAKAKAFSDLAQAKKKLSDLISKKEKEALLKASSNNANERDVELRDVQRQYIKTVSETNVARQELEKLKVEMYSSSKGKEEENETGQDLHAIEIQNKKGDKLSEEISAAKKSLSVKRDAYVKANRERMALLSHGEPLTVDVLQSILDKKVEERESLKAEVGTFKALEGKAHNGYVKAKEELEKAKAELEQTRQLEASINTSLKPLITELEEAKLSLKKVFESRSELTVEGGLLQREVDAIKKTMGELKEREGNAKASANAVVLDLDRGKLELGAAKVAETKAKEEVVGLLQAWQQVNTEAEEAKAEVETARREASGVRESTEEARSVMKSTEVKLDEALKEASEAHLSEQVAQEKLNQLRQERSANKPESGSGITVSTAGCKSFERNTQLSEDLTNKRIDAAIARAEADRISEQETLKKVESLFEELAKAKSATEEAMQRARIAQEAKSALESELQRLRERESAQYNNNSPPIDETDEELEVTEQHETSSSTPPLIEVNWISSETQLSPTLKKNQLSPTLKKKKTFNFTSIWKRRNSMAIPSSSRF